MRIRGFSLVELLVAMALFSAISAGVISTVIAIGRAQQASARVDVAQTGVRAVMDQITHDIEMASAGATSGSYAFANGTPTTALAIQFTDSSTGPDRLDLIVTDPTGFATLVGNFSAANTTLAVNAVTNFPTTFGQIAVTDLVTPTILGYVSQAAGGNPSITVSAPTNALPRTYNPGALVFGIRRIAYYVDVAYLGALDPVLMYDDLSDPANTPAYPAAEGIEDLQIALGYDNNLDGQLTSVGAAPNDDEWVGNVSGDTIPASLANLKTVRVTLVARTVSTVGGTGGLRPAAENHPAAAARDANLRRVLRSEIMVRNLNL